MVSLRTQKIPAPMTRSVSKVEREGVINSLVKNKRKEDFTLFYYSLWDDRSDKVNNAMTEWVDKNPNSSEVVHTVNSWDLPHSFMVFSVTTVPALVTCRKGRIRVETYFPRVLKYFTK